MAQYPWTFTSTATTETVSSLENSQHWTFTISAVNARGAGAQSVATPVIIGGTPTAPTMVTATPKHLAATIHWTAPATNGAAITSYTITPYVNGVAKTAHVFHSAATTVTYGGLTTGSHCQFKVAATNSRGIGQPSALTASIKIT